MSGIGPKKKYIVRLTQSERQWLHSLIRTGKVAAHKRLRAQILLLSDEGEFGPGYKDKAVVEKLDIGICTVERTRQRLVEMGLENSLERVKRLTGPNPKKFTVEQEAKLIALACMEPPTGHARWSLKLLSQQMVALEYVDSVSRETVRQVLKKHHQTLAA